MIRETMLALEVSPVFRGCVFRNRGNSNTFLDSICLKDSSGVLEDGSCLHHTFKQKKQGIGRFLNIRAATREGIGSACGGSNVAVGLKSAARDARCSGIRSKPNFQKRGGIVSPCGSGENGTSRVTSEEMRMGGHPADMFGCAADERSKREAGVVFIDKALSGKGLVW